jgi:hypothetical protein
MLCALALPSAAAVVGPMVNLAQPAASGVVPLSPASLSRLAVGATLQAQRDGRTSSVYAVCSAKRRLSTSYQEGGLRACSLP